MHGIHVVLKDQSIRHTRVNHKNMMVCEMHLHLAIG
jgi:hypothetical protein